MDANLGEQLDLRGLAADDRSSSSAPKPIFRRAIELDPNYATAHRWYGVSAARLGRSDESLAHVELAAELDPLLDVVTVNLGRPAGILGASTRQLRV